MTVIDSRLKLLTCRQDDNQSMSDYYKEFKSRAEVTAVVDGEQGVGREGAMFGGIGEECCKVNQVDKPDNPNDDWRQKVDAFSHNQLLAMLFIRNSSGRRYGSLKAKLRNSCVHGNNNYPATLTKSYKLLQNYKSEVPNKP